MKLKDRFFKPEYERHPEAVANKYTIHGMTVAMLLLVLIWILNVLNVFLVHKQTIAFATFIALAEYVVGMLIFSRLDLRKIWVKYVIIFWTFSIVTVLTVFLTFHAYLACLLPIIYCSMYSSKKLMRYAYALTLVNIILTVYIGYYVGLCDANMALLSGEPLASYTGANGEFLLTQINDRTWWTLPLFFVLPRSIICLAIAMICSRVSRIIQDNVRYAHEMEQLAEIDEMTGVYNRNKYLAMTSEAYIKEDKLAVIFWDINYLKKVNDTLGHEKGDVLIKMIAAAIQKISNQFDHVYRIGGDEFVMIMRGGDEIHALKKIKEWEDAVSVLDNIEDIPVSAAYGYAFGKGVDLEEIIHQADVMMYENKRRFHEEKQI